MDFVSYDIAKKLKEKGFRELCTHFYRYGTSTPQEMFCGLRSNTHHKWSFNSMEVKLKDTHERVQVNMIDAPTISQVLKWLREEKKVHIQILFVCPPNKWEYITIKTTNCELRGMRASFASYELAAIAGIEYVIDNLI